MAKDQQLRKTILVLQGGGALGAYQVGAFQALEEFGYQPDMVIGISIGAINAAIIAGNPPQHRLARLAEFWNTVTTSTPVPGLIDSFSLDKDKIHNWLGAQNAMFCGQPGFFVPKLTHPSVLSGVTPDKISYYDTTPLRDTLLRLVDFKYLNQKHTRLALGSVEIASGEFVFFDSFEQEITPEHIMASGALPPGLPAIEIEGKYYIDGGVYSNTPLARGINQFMSSQEDRSDRLCFIVDLFSAKGENPQNLDQLLERINEIQYSSHARGASPFYTIAINLAHAVQFLGQHLSEEGAKNPLVQTILDKVYVHKVDIIQLIYHSADKSSLPSKSYNFNKDACEAHEAVGYRQTCELIERYQLQWEESKSKVLTLYSLEGVTER